ncbi:MAG: RNA-binding domain-containing protein [Dehalococcoidia bacterium]
MIERLEGFALLDLMRKLPEQSKYDCKRDLTLDSHDRKAELIKDITSIANAHGDEVGYLFFGVDPVSSELAVGITQRHDDATLQQIVNSKLERPVSFLYYETEVNGSWVGVAVIPPSITRPHIIKAQYGRLRAGQIPIRRGSSTTWATSEDLQLMLERQRARESQGQDIAELVRRAGDPAVPVAQLALEVWQLGSQVAPPEHLEWLRLEIAGFKTGSVVPDYREVAGHVSVFEINLKALSFHNLDSIVQTEPDKFKEVPLRLGQSIAELEDMLGPDGSGQGAGFFQTRRQFETQNGEAVEAYLYFKPSAVRRVVTLIRNRIARFLMTLHAS